MKKLSVQTAGKALERLANLLKDNNIKIDMTVAGGVVSLFVLKSRNATHDIDAIFPDNPGKQKLLKKLIIQVADEMKLEKTWLNDSLSFFGLETKSDIIVFRHSHLILRAAEWEELLAHKIHAFRSRDDINDARLILKKLKGFKKEELFRKIKKYKPISPHIPDEKFRERFEQLWEEVYPNKE
ncbi:MAG TPA: hypothetical protein DCQ37_16470 [Desulfobacteraceae bacterium]|nr:hypothetical protein [Desulfobacteraceae bacterium]